MKSQLIIKFTDESPSYTYGFEAGIIFSICESGIRDFNKTIHRSNIEVVKKICKEYGYIFELKGYKDFDYANIFAIKSTITHN